MADSKISALAASTTPLAGTEVLAVVQGGATKKVSVANLTAGRDVGAKKLQPTDNVEVAAGKGIDFTANGGDLLAQYDEGTWTPSLSSSGGSITTSSATGYYTRVGRMVTVNVEATITNAGTATGALIVSLPFSTGNYKTAVGAGREDGATGVMIQVFAGPSSSTCAVFIYNNNTVLVSGYVAKFSLTYQM